MAGLPPAGRAPGALVGTLLGLAPAPGAVTLSCSPRAVRVLHPLGACPAPYAPLTSDSPVPPAIPLLMEGVSDHLVDEDKKVYGVFHPEGLIMKNRI